MSVLCPKADMFSAEIDVLADLYRPCVSTATNNGANYLVPRDETCDRP
jgi:hypothetical protein